MFPFHSPSPDCINNIFICSGKNNKKIDLILQLHHRRSAMSSVLMEMYIGGGRHVDGLLACIRMLPRFNG